MAAQSIPWCSKNRASSDATTAAARAGETRESGTGRRSIASLFPSARRRSWRARMNAVVDGSRQRRRTICGSGTKTSVR